MDRIAVLVTFADGATTKVFAQLPARMRTAGPDGALLLVDDRAYRIGDERGIDAPTLQRLVQLRELVDTAALGPLQRAQACTRDADGRTFTLADATGATWTLQLGADSLLPRTLTAKGGDGAGRPIAFDAFLPTSATWMPSRLSHPALGAVTLTFDLADMQWATDFFDPPATRVAVPQVPTVVMPSTGGMESRSPTPIAGSAAALQLALVADPGDWPGRAAAYAPLHAELERQNQKIAGFPMLFRDGERDVLAAPFRRREQGPAFVAPTGWELRALPAAELLVVYPPAGDFATRRRAGETMLLAALQANGRKADGPIVAQPFLHLQDGAPADTKLAAPVVRMTVALAPR